MRHIVCFGNPLHGDDGFGYAVYRRLIALPLPDNVRAFDAGTPGPAALALFQGCDEVVIVDAIRADDAPATLCHVLPEALADDATPAGHGVGVAYLLKALAALPEPMPRIRIVAAPCAAPTPFRPGLSAAVDQMVDEAVAWLCADLELNNDE